MTRRHVDAAILTILVVLLLRATPALAHGDKVVPHVVDGSQPDGIRYRTKFDITNLSLAGAQPLRKVTLLFFKDDGSPWTVSAKDHGAISTLPLNLSPTQTARVETTGAGSIASGFAIIRNIETTTTLPDDYEVAITVYYEVLRGDDVIETVSVPIGPPTVSWAFPVEVDKSSNLLTGLAIVNVTDAPNSVAIELYSSAGVKYPQSATFVLSGGGPRAKKLVQFLDEAGIVSKPFEIQGNGIRQV
jgi:hypothetical protein